MNNQAPLAVTENQDEWEKKKGLLKRTVCKGSTDEQFQLFLHACKRTGLDPFMRQIYAVMRFDKKEGKNQMTIQTGIDGYRLIAERTGKYSPGRDATFTYDDNGRPFCATAYIKKQTQDGTWHEVSASAFLSEYQQEYSSFWKKMPHTMLAKCAEALALRKAFPAELSGIYTHEEMAQADQAIVEEQVKEKNTFRPTRIDLAECRELAVKVWASVREKKPDISETPHADLPYYLYNFQSVHPNLDVVEVFSQPCSNAETFLRKFYEWSSSREGQNEIESISIIDEYKTAKQETEQERMAG